MNTYLPDRQILLERLLVWAQARPDIQALALVGSSARAGLPADAWSDIDLLLLTADPDFYLASPDWCAEIAEPWIATVERAPDGRVVERRVLFRGGVDVDFLILAADKLGALREEPLKSITARGMRVLFDRAGILPSLTPDALLAPIAPEAAEFAELVADFWFHAVWTAKKLRRGELFTAKSCCDGYMKRHLLALIEWRAATEWYGGRFIERWAGAEVVDRLSQVYAHYTEADIWRALAATMELFDDLARELAQARGFPYPAAQAQQITTWVNARLAVEPPREENLSTNTHE